MNAKGAPAYRYAALGDFVWHDIDADGIQDAGETGVSGVGVELFNGAGVSQATTSTAGDGSYSFTGVPPGSHSVESADLVGYDRTTASPVTISVDPVGTAEVVFGYLKIIPVIFKKFC